MALAWTQLAPSTTPDPDSGYTMGYDPANDRIIMFSSHIGSGSNTWAFSGGDWDLLVSATGSITWVRNAAMAYDGTGMLLYGGFGPNGGSVIDDTCRFTGAATWTLLDSSSDPGNRELHAMVWDGTQVVMFGGHDGVGGYLGDTWVWDGSDWTELSPATPPPERRSHMLAMDWGTGKVVLFGGEDSGGLLDDTWTFADGEWTEESPAASPPGRTRGAFAFDGVAPILFGGTHPSRLNDTWAYRGGTWTDCAPASPPSARQKMALVYDGTRALLFGGDTAGGDEDDTWIVTGACGSSGLQASLNHTFGIG